MVRAITIIMFLRDLNTKSILIRVCWSVRAIYIGEACARKGLDMEALGLGLSFLGTFESVFLPM